MSGVLPAKVVTEKSKNMMTDLRKFLKSLGCGGAVNAGKGATHGTALSTERPGSVSRPEWAKKRFLTHWHCTQAILETYCTDYGLSQDLALKIAAPFAVGMGRGMLCGAVAGAYLVLGLAKGKSQVDDKYANDPVFADVKALTAALEKTYGDLSCSVLMGTDMATPQGIKAAGSKGLFKTKCLSLVEQTAVQLDKLL